MSALPGIWVTRPEPHASRLCTAMQHAGVAAIASPVMEIIHDPHVPAPSQTPDALMVTSQHAIIALAGLPEHFKEKPIYTVGETSAEILRSLGWQPKHAAEPGAPAMLALLKEDMLKGSRLLYLCGDVLRWDMASALHDAGLRVSQLEVYQAHAAEALSPDCLAALQAGNIRALTLYSPRSAAIAAGLMRDAALEAPLVALCISDDIAAAAGKAGFTECYITDSAGDEAMVALAQSVIGR